MSDALCRCLVVVLLAVSVACGKHTPVITPEPTDPFAIYAHVITVAQKMAKDPSVPYYQPSTNTHCTSVVDVLHAASARQGVTIENWPLVVLKQTFSDPAEPRDVFGVTLHESKRILVGVEVASCGRAEILAHELAHLVGPSGLSLAEEEFAADLVQYGVNRALGYDTMKGTAQYLKMSVNAVTVDTRIRTWVLLTVDSILK